MEDAIPVSTPASIAAEIAHWEGVLERVLTTDFGNPHVQQVMVQRCLNRLDELVRGRSAASEDAILASMVDSMDLY